MEYSLNPPGCRLATKNTNPTYIADTDARIKARNEAAAIHMNEQTGIRRGVSKASLGLANGVDRIGALFADATAAGVAGGVFGAFQGAIVGAVVAVVAGFFLPFVLGAGTVAAFSGLFALTGFANEYTRLKASNPEKKNAARADWLAAKGGALDGPGLPPLKPKTKGPYSHGNPGNGAQVDEATANARGDRERAQATVDRVAPQTPPPGSGGQPYPSATTATASFDAPTGPGFVEKENIRRSASTSVDARSF